LNKLRSLVNNHPLISFFVVACAYSWGLWGLMMASSRGLLPFSFPTNWTGSFGPSVAAVIVTAIGGGRGGVRDLLRPIARWRFGAGWYVFVLAGCLLPIGVSIGIRALLDGGVSLSSDAVIKQLAQIPILYFLILIIGGPLGEEIGWRGYALPWLLKRMSGLSASLVVFPMWLIWHLPLFWLEGASQQGSSIAAFVVVVAASSVLFTWVYVGTSGSLVSVLLLHTTVNTFSYSISQASPALDNEPLFNWLVAAAFGALAIVVVIADKRRMLTLAAPEKPR
jgi:membrane protease YdiL (CAAX protease family)